MSESNEFKLVTGQRAVTAAGTPEAIMEATKTVEARVKSVSLRAKTGNAGDIYITNSQDRGSASTVGDILAPGESIVYEVTFREWVRGKTINLTKFWIDAATSGDGISFSAEREF